MYIASDKISSENMMEEIKDRIKVQYHSQESIGNKIHVGRKTVNRILNKESDIQTFLDVCKVLGIKEIRID